MAKEYKICLAKVSSEGAQIIPQLADCSRLMCYKFLLHHKVGEPMVPIA